MSPEEKAEVILIVIKRIGKRVLRWLLIATIFVVVVGASIYIYNEVMDYYSTKNTEKETAREENARFCIAEDIKRMEGVVKDMSSAISDGDNLKTIAPKLNKIANGDAFFNHPDEDIKQSVLIYEIHTKCDSKFNLLINIRADENDKLRWFRVWGQNSPKGYPSDNIEKFTVDYDFLRKSEESKKVSNDKQQASAALCAVGLSKQERLNRLSKYGPVTQTAENEYYSGGHHLSFDYFGLNSCY